MPRLIVSPGTPDARQIALQEGVHRIGRGPTNDVTIDDGSVSGSHCQLIISQGGIRIRDVGSTNGTFVNGTPVQETDLQPGQRIQLGGVQLMLEGDSTLPNELAGAPSLPPPPPVTLTPSRAVARLRVAQEPATPPPVPETPESTTFEESAPATHLPGANALCKYHPRTPAHWNCTGCHKTFCDLCVTTRGGDGRKYCRSCSAVCTELHIHFEAPQERTFFKELPRAVIYPFRGTGVLVIIVATIVFAALGFLSGGITGIITKAVALGYFFAFVQSIIHTTASGDDTLPHLPPMEGLISNFFRLAGTVLMSFGPAILFLFLAVGEEQPWAGIALIPAVIFGCLYFPMAFLAVAIKDNVLASNPLVVVPSILRVPLEYMVTAVLLVAVFGMRWLGDTLSASMGGKALMTSSMSEMFLLFGLRAIWAFVSVYLLTVTMRILGLLYLTRRDRLGW